jgi:thiol-disulfide isomerase/thioredoxin
MSVGVRRVIPQQPELIAMPMMPPNIPPNQRTRFIIGMVIVALGLLMMMMFGKNPALGQAKLNTGHMAAFVYKAEPVALPALRFVDAKGQEKTLKDWQGKVVLLNLWATWCAPCRKEMPDLDKLQAEMGSDTFEVVALGVDRGGVKAAEKFLEQVGTKKLALYVDPTAKLANELRVIGLPATLLIDGQGREIGRLLGPAEWASDDAKALIKSVMR